MAERQALTFPDGFLWGAATASHQYEGGNTNNQWYAWEPTGHIKTGESCGRACDWWDNAEHDFDAAAADGAERAAPLARMEPHRAVARPVG